MLPERTASQLLAVSVVTVWFCWVVLSLERFSAVFCGFLRLSLVVFWVSILDQAGTQLKRRVGELSVLGCLRVD